MAGKELRGAAAADADLFRGRPWILTSDPDHPVAAEFRRWIALFGAREIMLDAARARPPCRLEFASCRSWHRRRWHRLLHDRAPDAANVAGPGLCSI